jgi:hypothetical protein
MQGEFWRVERYLDVLADFFSVEGIVQGLRGWESGLFRGRVLFESERRLLQWAGRLPGDLEEVRDSVELRWDFRQEIVAECSLEVEFREGAAVRLADSWAAVSSLACNSAILRVRCATGMEVRSAFRLCNGDRDWMVEVLRIRSTVRKVRSTPQKT